MMTLEQVRAVDKAANPRKLLPTTIAFLKEMREIANSGRSRRDEQIKPWTDRDESR